METLQIFTNVPGRACNLGDLCNVPLEMEILQIVHKPTPRLTIANFWRQYLSLAKNPFPYDFIYKWQPQKETQDGLKRPDIFIRKLDANLEVKITVLFDSIESAMNSDSIDIPM